MAASPALASAPGRLADNVLQFARVLRRAGLPVGTDRVMLALRALQAGALERRDDFHAALAACFVDRAEHRMLFDQAFELFWQPPDLEPRPAQPPRQAAPLARPSRPAARRLAAALPSPASQPPPTRVEIEARFGWSGREALRKADFATLSADEWHEAKRLVSRLRAVAEALPTRRTEPAPHPGRPDPRATLRALARHGGDGWTLRWQRRRRRPAPIVVLADISGSMSRYSRMLLHFAHALGASGPRVASFVFGTRLTDITRTLRQRDPDVAVAAAVAAVDDWSGGTRLASCLREFNRRWARRVLPAHGTVLLITDGLERGEPAPLAFEMERLHKSCRRLIWLNPLLRYEQFEPRAAGIRAMLPHVDRFVPAHDLDSLTRLAALLEGAAANGRDAPVAR